MWYMSMYKFPQMNGITMYQIDILKKYLKEQIYLEGWKNRTVIHTLQFTNMEEVLGCWTDDILSLNLEVGYTNRRSSEKFIELYTCDAYTFLYVHFLQSHFYKGE